MKTQFKMILITALFVASAPSYAVLGIGDLSFDPTNWMENSSTYQQAVDAYEVSVEQLDTIDRIDETMTQAYDNYESLKSFNYKGIVARYTQIGNVGKGDFMSRVRRLRNNMRRAKYSGGNDTHNVDRKIKASVKGLEDAKKDLLMQNAAAENIKNSANSKMGESGRITAQNTSLLAQIAADDQVIKARKRDKEQDAEDLQRSAIKSDFGLYNGFRRQK